MAGGQSVYSGVRIVKLELKESEKDRIPHIVKLGPKDAMLITCRGRLPICLKCHFLGHVRSECPRNAYYQRRPEPVPSTTAPVKPPASYAEALKKTPVDSDSDQLIMDFVQQDSEDDTGMSFTPEAEASTDTQASQNWKTLRSRRRKSSTQRTRSKKIRSRTMERQVTDGDSPTRSRSESPAPKLDKDPP